MKKNLLSILILALLVVNLVLSGITMISITGTNKKTAALVGSIASKVDLELTAGAGEEAEASIPMEDTEIIDIPESLTIPLRKGNDDKDHFALVTASLAINTKDKDYKKHGATLSEKLSMIKGEINDVYSQYTKEEAVDHKSDIEQEVLARVQKMFDSQFIYKVILSEVYQ